MIENIKLNNIASYTTEVELSDLRKINFFYGSNGSGKTTISKLLANPDDYPSCTVKWKSNNKLKTLVYNEDFVQKYFYAKDVLNGIYTMGEGAKEIEEDINRKNEEINKLNQKRENLQETIKTKKDEEESIDNNFKDTFWEKGYTQFQKDFPDFYTGYRRDKERLKEKILEEHNKSNTTQVLNLDELKDKYRVIYGKNVQKIDLIDSINENDLRELKTLEANQTILQTPIVGKKDIDISKMIEKLHNHDWVKQGKEYYDKNYDETKGGYICPFCQQETSDDFKKQLEEYFDETFTNQMEDLEKYIKKYKEVTNNIKNYFQEITSKQNNFLDEKKDTINDKIKIIEGIINQNIQTLENKRNSPSSTFEIQNIFKDIEDFTNNINEINNKINEHNNLIENKETEKPNLDNEIWKFIVNELKSDIEDYNNNINDIEKALKNLNNQLMQQDESIKKLKNEISELEKKIKSVKPTVEAINKILDNFGFKGFKLKATVDEKHYQVIRNDGTDAKKTLSEGERNFLVFLYFYHLIKGVENPEEIINEPRILVIDDPVSSLDSNVLYIVSTLINEILSKVRNNDEIIRQVFIFTHNAYFFKEITFISSRESCYNKRNDTIYYIIRKIDNVSNIEKYEKSPIKTSYQLLWDEIGNDRTDCASMQNSMRRIIEFYFKFLANLDEKKLLEKFTDRNEQLICRSLIAWINAGSHEIIDDFNISISKEQVKNYKTVFKKIFEYSGHIAHYDMMMANSYEDKGT